MIPTTCLTKLLKNLRQHKKVPVRQLPRLMNPRNLDTSQLSQLIHHPRQGTPRQETSQQVSTTSARSMLQIDLHRALHGKRALTGALNCGTAVQFGAQPAATSVSKHLRATISILITPAQIVSQNPAVDGKRSKSRTLTLVFLDHERHLKVAESRRQS